MERWLIVVLVKLSNVSQATDTVTKVSFDFYWLVLSFGEILLRFRWRIYCFGPVPEVSCPSTLDKTPEFTAHNPRQVFLFFPFPFLFYFQLFFFIYFFCSFSNKNELKDSENLSCSQTNSYLSRRANAELHLAFSKKGFSRSFSTTELLAIVQCFQRTGGLSWRPFIVENVHENGKRKKMQQQPILSTHRSSGEQHHTLQDRELQRECTQWERESHDNVQTL